ncbi:hypothetical protein [Helicobacter trogontum]|nr:hypothetical protein [Helicobacter trogontum]
MRQLEIKITPLRLRFLMNFCGFQTKGEGSVYIIHDRALSADAVA